MNREWKMVPPADDVEVLGYASIQVESRRVYEIRPPFMPFGQSYIEWSKGSTSKIHCVELVDRAHVTRLTAENARLQAALEDLREDFYLMRQECESAKRNASAFEDRMCDLQVSEGNLKAELVTQCNHFREQLRDAKNADALQAELTKARELSYPKLMQDNVNLTMRNQQVESLVSKVIKAGVLACQKHEQLESDLCEFLAHQAAPAAKDETIERPDNCSASHLDSNCNCNWCRG